MGLFVFLKPVFWFNLVLPVACPVCGDDLPLDEAGPVCAACRGRLSPLSFGCPRCGKPYSGKGSMGYLCSNCRRRKQPQLELVRSAGAYRSPLKELILAVKFGRRPAVARYLADWLAAHLPQDIVRLPVDAVLPVPLDRGTLRQRGFNQSLVLARRVAKELSSPLLLYNLYRHTFQAPQTALSGRQRRENVRGNFALRRPQEIAGLRLLLVDDVYTTGATLEECAKLLRRAGARCVWGLTLARAEGAGS